MNLTGHASVVSTCRSIGLNRPGFLVETAPISYAALMVSHRRETVRIQSVIGNRMLANWPVFGRTPHYFEEP